MRERGFLAAWRFYREHFRPVFVLSVVFYLIIVGIAALSVLELGFGALFAWAYLILVSIFWLQAPLARLMDDLHAGRPNAGARRTLAELGPRLGSITGGSVLAAVGVYLASYLLVLPGLLLLARWACSYRLSSSREGGRFGPSAAATGSSEVTRGEWSSSYSAAASCSLSSGRSRSLCSAAA